VVRAEVARPYPPGHLPEKEKPMSSKVKIATVTTTETEVEIPDICPACNADLTEFEAVRETGFVAYSCYCHGEHGEMQAEGESDVPFEDVHRTRYECLGCGLILAGE